ncbi:TIGR00730 family Rossman fold protein [Mesorhizobium sp. BR1-1-16]|uniref:LOG family protein n=1 Tax=Mesorhizobium sp. BR1-1-16 TaxID=2876653 RepID=UPI001CCBEC43|nr:TIGR00730 family Rossman fold protein [Mesorhizobium sp. BR1-1-16]MBZ9934945.1 TIGR00730 family Rossman fold protein [Mesorhizobium sp. BR1-1-16]
MRLCVFCGSNEGFRPEYRNAAVALGQTIAAHDSALIYGGSKVGLMGAVADAVLAAGGTVIGIIPQALVDKEVAHHGLTELHVVGSMHERKAKMADMAEGFVALPGGIGTLEELFEIWTWAQLGYHGKPVGVLDIAGFYGKLLAFLDHQAEEGFMRREHRDMLIVENDPEQLIQRYRNYQPPQITKWIKSGQR